MDFLKDIFTKDTVCVCLIDEDFKFLKVNNSLESLLGYDSCSLDNKSIKIVLSDLDFNRLRVVLNSAKLQKSSPCYAQNFFKKNGDTFLAILATLAIFDEDNNFKYFAIFIFDHVDSLSDKNCFSISNAILEKTLDSIEDIVFFKDHELRYKIVNKSFLRATKLKLKDVIGKKDEDIFPKDIAMKYSQKNLGIMENKTLDSYENIYHRKGDKKEHKIRVTLHKISGKNSKFLGILGTAYDLELNTELKHRQKLIQNVFENSSEGMIITDENEVIIATNQAFTDITGYTQDELKGLTPRVLISGRHNKKFYEDMWRHIKRKDFWYGEIINKGKDGKEYPEILTISCVKDDIGNVVNYIGLFSVAAKLKRTKLKLQHLSKNDLLTGLPNRTSLEFNITQTIKRAKRHNYKVGFLYFDLDNFKDINDTFGHTVGDDVIVQVAKRLKSSLRKIDMISRVGGDEFMLVLENIISVDNLKVVIDKVFTIFQTPFIVCDKIFNVTCSIGVSIYPNDGDDMNTLFKNADTAMYEAKNTGKNSFCFYTKSLTNALFQKIELENDMRRGLKSDEFFVLYQPQIDIIGNKIVGAEALVRWQHSTKNTIMPDSFIPIAEDNKLINQIGLKVLKIVCKDIKNWLDKGIDLSNFTISVNVSAVQLKYDDMYKNIKIITKRFGILPKYLRLELTETSIMENSQKVLNLFNKLSDEGVKLSIDDFGKGYSSFAYLKKFATTQIKIDRSFIKNIPADKDDIVITKTILALGKSMELEVIAEGVENEQHRDFLLKEGCCKAQGYFYSKPIKKEELEEKFLSKI